MTAIDDPLVAAPPAEVPLDEAPLVRVIAQIRFPEILAVEQREAVAPFQAALKSTYPVLRETQIQRLVMGAEGFTGPRPKTAWRFIDSDEAWSVTLSPDFLALETRKYESRADFVSRLGVVASALHEHFEPAKVDRLGIRYIDRITGDDVDQIATLVRPEVRGVLGTLAADHALHSVCESVFGVDRAQVRTRWGRMPANATIDPAAIEPLDEPSWVLDIDMYSTAPLSFDVETLTGEARRYAERIYTIFRWAVTDAFLERFGGQR